MKKVSPELYAYSGHKDKKYQQKFRHLIKECQNSLNFFQQNRGPSNIRNPSTQNKLIQDNALKIQNLKAQMKRFLTNLNLKKNQQYNRPEQIIKIIRPFQDKYSAIDFSISKEPQHLQNTANFFLSDNLRIAKKVKRYLKQNANRKDQNHEVSIEKENNEQIQEYSKMRNKSLKDELMETLEKIQKANQEKASRVINLTERKTQKRSTKYYQFVQRNQKGFGKENYQSSKEEQKMNHCKNQGQKVLKINQKFNKKFIVKKQLQNLHEKMFKKFPNFNNESIKWMTDQRKKALQQSYVLKHLRELQKRYSENQIKEELKNLNFFSNNTSIDENDEQIHAKGQEVSFCERNIGLKPDFIKKMNPTFLLRENKKLMKKQKAKNITKIYL